MTLSRTRCEHNFSLNYEFLKKLLTTRPKSVLIYKTVKTQIRMINDLTYEERMTLANDLIKSVDFNTNINLTAEEKTEPT